MKNNSYLKFDFGKNLFADPYYKPSTGYSNKKYLEFLNGVYQEIELNTSDEKIAFKQIYDYFKDPTNLISRNILESLKVLKKKFPKILDPLYDDLYNAYIQNITYYRGGSLRIEQLKDLSFERGKTYNDIELHKAILKNPKTVYEGTGRKHYLSFSRDFNTALEFALQPYNNKNFFKKLNLKKVRIPVIIGISGSDENLILNPDFSDAVSPFWEDESIHVSNSIKLKELYVLNSNYYLNYFDRLDKSDLNKSFRDELRKKLI